MAVVGPVFKKELLEASRRKRYLLLRCLIPACFLFAVFIVWSESPYRQGYMSVIQQQSTAGRHFFEAWMFLITMTLGVAAPMLIGGLIASERERGSLELLFTTDLSSREIVLGKVASRIAILWLLAFGSAPALEIVAVLGGVSFEQVFGVLIITLSGAAFISSVGLYYSAVTRRPWIAIVRTYFFFAIIWMVLPFCLMGVLAVLREVFDYRGFFPSPSAYPEIFTLHLPICLIAQIEQRMFGTRAMDMAVWNSVVSWVAAGVFLFLAHRNLRELQVRPSKRWWMAPIRWGKSRLDWALRPLQFLGQLKRYLPQPTPAQMESFLSRQPVAWRNLKASVFDPDRYLFKIQRFLGVVLLLFLGIGTIAFKPPRANDFVVFTVMTVAVIHFLLAVLTAGSVSRERERGSLDLLRMTMLTPNQIVVGNAVGAFRAVRFTLWVLFALLVYAVLFHVFTFSFTVAYTAILAVGMLCIASQAMLVSTAAPNTIAAMAAAVAVGFVWWVAPACLEDNDTRGVSLGMAGAFFPFAFLPMTRKPKLVQWICAGLASLVVLGFLSWSRIESSWVAFVILAIIACLSMNWLRSPFVHARLVAAGVCCITVPLSIGLLACTLLHVELRSVDEMMLYARYVVDVDRTQLWNDGYLRRGGTTRWAWSESNWAALTFFCTTLISTGLIHLITLKAFPKLTQPN